MNNSEETIFEAARKLEGEQRSAFLDAACGNDANLRQRIDNLLVVQGEANQFFDQRAAATLVNQTGPVGTAPLPIETRQLAGGIKLTEGPGSMIGRYKLLEKVGEGGFGVVYVAEQREPVKRRVALKIIKLGMDTKQVVARFEAERQALALMDHPNIAKVLDAGSTDTGRPYFVMELVRGIRITDYCDQNQLSTHERLDLFIKVCQAVQHAHQKGLIHRDIKPSNILVTLHDGVPVPKVIDFGIAKATQQELTEKTVYTQLQEFIGTPAYMSPEQAEMSGLDIDTRSDIYSLGVLLYELLTGTTPFDAQELLRSGLDAMRKTIREQEPPRPSMRLNTLQGEALTTTAKRRGLEPPKLINLLRGDLDWIVMRCLEKDRTRRYETANGLAADIQRHLGNEPVAACPPSTAYRFQKLVRRNKLAFAAAGGVVATLVLGLGLSAWQYWEKSRALKQTEQALQARNAAAAAEQRANAAMRSALNERKTALARAEKEANTAKQVQRFLGLTLEDLTVAANQDASVLNQVLEPTLQRVQKDLKDQPAVAMELLNTMGWLFASLESRGRAGTHRGKAETILRQAIRLGESAPDQIGPQDLIVSHHGLAKLLLHQKKTNEAGVEFISAIKVSETLINTNNKAPLTFDLYSSIHNLLFDWAAFLLNAGRDAEAEGVLLQKLAFTRNQLTKDSPSLAYPLLELAAVQERLGRAEQAETNLRDAMRIGLSDTAIPLRYSDFLLRHRRFEDCFALLKHEASLVTNRAFLWYTVIAKETSSRQGEGIVTNRVPAWDTTEHAERMTQLAWQWRPVNPERALVAAQSAVSLQQAFRKRLQQAFRKNQAPTKEPTRWDEAWQVYCLGKSLLAQAAIENNSSLLAEAEALLTSGLQMMGQPGCEEFYGRSRTAELNELASHWLEAAGSERHFREFGEKLKAIAEWQTQRPLLREQAAELVERGKIKEAEAIWQQIADQDQRNPANVLFQSVKSSIAVANFKVKLEDFEKAEQGFLEAYPLIIQQAGSERSAFRDLVYLHRFPESTFWLPACYLLAETYKDATRASLEMGDGWQFWFDSDAGRFANLAQGPRTKPMRDLLDQIKARFTVKAGKIVELSPLTSTEIRRACINNLRQIAGAKEYWGLENRKKADDVPSPLHLYGAFAYLKEPPVCPGGGVYTIGPLKSDPICSLQKQGHRLE